MEDSAEAVVLALSMTEERDDVTEAALSVAELHLYNLGKYICVLLGATF